MSSLPPTESCSAMKRRHPCFHLYVERGTEEFPVYTQHVQQEPGTQLCPHNPQTQLSLHSSAHRELYTAVRVWNYLPTFKEVLEN